MKFLTNHFGQFVATFLVASLMLFATSITQASPYQVQTGYLAVPGSQELEVGDVDGAISKLQPWLEVTTGRTRGSILTNLCTAYITKGDFDKAESFCDQALASECRNSSLHSSNRSFSDAIAHNNRGVLRAMQGDHKGAISDFDLAGLPVRDPTDVRRVIHPYGAVVKANLKAVEESRLAAMGESDTQVADVK